ncbi:MAG: PD40 domain-containing protein [Chlorogloeopsis fritschii C42_A2020_084]|uniref:WD40 repeat domain-containing protein n=1 Tax=Chlorogloeopsis fritschii TaxID=1124 RepID=UPI0019FAF861|nr:hypothetical protein [Chlorogloeopsis fritschii]MBF2006137.1 PD40 domain-containing protein [Chlorogloeopsis fritschii C42_A2020_084]
MFSLKNNNQGDFQYSWRGSLLDYITAMTWSPDGTTLAVSSAAGEVALLAVETQELTFVQSSCGLSIDCLSFSKDGQFLAAGGQDGQVKIWGLVEEKPELVTALNNAPAWVDRMAWSPTQNQLAFSLGRNVQVWDADIGDIATNLNFDNSSVLDITWHPDGQRLTVGGYQEVKIWNSQDWNDTPYLLIIGSASVAIAWSGDGKYIASGNMDRTITVLEWENPEPWVMRGFPGKIRKLAWSQVPSKIGTPMLAAASMEGVIVWQKHEDESIGWEGRVLPKHESVVQSLQFQPHSLLLASAGEDGWVCLWQRAKKLAQVLNEGVDGFSCLSWHPQGHQLAAGGQSGELLIWTKGSRAQGFGRRS